MKLIFATFLAVCFVVPVKVYQEKPYVIEYHHTQHIYKHDDIGLKRLTVKDVEGLL